MKNQEHFSFYPPAGSYKIIDKSVLPTPSDLFTSFPHQSLVVLDFALRMSAIESQTPSQTIFDQHGRFIANVYNEDSRVLLNIDHHNDIAGKIDNFSTTHQVISAVDDGILQPGKTDQLVVLNHDDTDSVLSLLLATHTNIPFTVLTLFAEAAAAADHTGEPNTLVNIVDAFYKYNDIEALSKLINAFIHQQELIFPDQKSDAKYHKYENFPRVITEYVQAVLQGIPTALGKGRYDSVSQILWLEPVDKGIDTIRTLPIVQNLGIPVKIIMTSELLDQSTKWSKISLRTGPSFPKNQTLEQLASELQLEKFGYGGRRNAGGIGRYKGEKVISAPEMFLLLQKALEFI